MRPKNRTAIHVILPALLIAMTVFACRRFEEYPPEPSITYMGFAVELDTTNRTIDYGTLSFGYLDGDGDIGLDENDTISPFGAGDEYYYNLIISYFEIQHGDTVRVFPLTPNADDSYDTTSFNARIPRLLDASQGERSVEGVINYRMLINNPFSDFDTIMFRAYIIDRALHKSNEIKTDLIIRNYSHYINQTP